MTNADKHYADATLEDKQLILGSMFNEKLVFDGNEYRTAGLEEAVALICKGSKALKKLKAGQMQKNSDLTRSVPQTGIEPVRPLGTQDFKSCVSTSSTTGAG